MTDSKHISNADTVSNWIAELPFPPESLESPSPSDGYRHKPFINRPCALLIISVICLILVAGSVTLDAFIIQRYVNTLYTAPGVCAGIVSMVTIILGLVLLRYQTNTIAIIVLIADAVAICANVFAAMLELYAYYFGAQVIGSWRQVITNDLFHIGVVVLCLAQLVLFVAHFALTAQATLTHLKAEQRKKLGQ
ncbi:unnamed protein product [Echinostoma caproni]|uniref:MARVEL domain-containing protein n=1 Tax=Echinostoma caproni TaxID=27848 RepID=A0A183ATS8_9TREM|nr:unnamed protein product [Echinostoma caproni]